MPSVPNSLRAMQRPRSESPAYEPTNQAASDAGSCGAAHPDRSVQGSSLARKACQTRNACRVAATSCTRSTATPCATPASAAASEPGRRSAGGAPSPASRAMKLLRDTPSRIGTPRPRYRPSWLRISRLCATRLAEADAGIDQQAPALEAGVDPGLRPRCSRWSNTSSGSAGVASVAAASSRARPGCASAPPAGRSRRPPRGCRGRGAAPRRR